VDFVVTEVPGNGAAIKRVLKVCEVVIDFPGISARTAVLVGDQSPTRQIIVVKMNCCCTAAVELDVGQAVELIVKIFGVIAVGPNKLCLVPIGLNNPSLRCMLDVLDHSCSSLDSC
jgi:hypothetical protein